MSCFKKSISFLILFLSLFNLNAQTASDSLKRLLPHTSGTEKMELLSHLIDAYLYSNLDSACLYAEKLLQTSNDENDKSYRSVAKRGLSICHFYNADYYKAEDYILQAVDLQKETGDTAGLANSYKILTGIYWETQRYNMSVEVSFQALQLYEAQNDTEGIISSYNNIGLLYKRLGESEKALLYFKKALFLAKTHPSDYSTGNLLNNTGLVFKELHQYDSTLVYYQKASAEYKKTNQLAGVATGYLNMGNLYLFHLNKPDSSLFYFNKALKLSVNTDYTIQSDIYSGIGAYYAGKNEYSKSISVFNKVLDLAEKHRDVEVEQDAHYDLYKVYKKAGNPSKAIFHLEKYNTLKDSLGMQKTKIAIANLESKFENEKNKILVNKLEDEHLKDDKIKLLLKVIIGSLFLVMILSASLFKQKRKKGKLKRALLEKENEHLEKDLQYKSRQLTSQALMMIQKNRLLNEISESLTGIKGLPDDSKKELSRLKRRLKKGIRSEEDWEMFKHYFEEVNPQFFADILKINNSITPSELKLCALIKLKFSIKETASLLNISPDSVKSIRYVLRRKLGMQKGENIYEFMNNI